MSEKTHERYNEDLALLEAKPKLKRPPLYKVILLNDDYTPMEFVVHILETFFCLDRETATADHAGSTHARHGSVW